MQTALTGRKQPSREFMPLLTKIVFFPHLFGLVFSGDIKKGGIALFG